MIEKLRNTIIPTEWGWICVLGCIAGITRMTLPQQSYRAAELIIKSWNKYWPSLQDNETFEDLAYRVQLYFTGQKVSFPDSLILSGSPFQRLVWEYTRTVDWGTTQSYSWLAEMLHSKSYARAVGAALMANPIPIIIPCHRIIGIGGEMRGFGGRAGTSLKRQLLLLEGASLHQV